MGYIVDTLASLAATDPHGYFAFFIPSRLNEYDWINEYFEAEFRKIAKSLGSRGVLVTSHRSSGDVIAEFGGLVRSQTLRTVDVSGARLLDSGFPLLVVTRYPICALESTTPGAEANCVALNLAAVANEKEIGRIIDQIVKLSEGETDDILDKLRPLGKQLRGSKWRRLTRSIKIEAPIVPGVKIDLKELAEALSQRDTR